MTALMIIRRHIERGIKMTIFIDYGTSNETIKNVRGIAPENDDTSVVIWYTEPDGQNVFRSIHYADYVRIIIL